jgi:hypothetical protein
LTRTGPEAGKELSFGIVTLLVILETMVGNKLRSKLGAIEGLLVESIPGGLKPICVGSFVTTSEKAELGA